jgi:DNA polymerase III subunit delta
MEHLKIIRDIELKNVKPVYLLAGEEPFFIDQVCDYLEDNYLDEASRAFCQTVVYGRDVSMDQVLSLAKGFPMMGDKQVVIVKEAQDMRDWKKQEDMKGFEAYLSHPTPSTLLLFAFKKGFDKRTKIYKSIEKAGVVFNSEKVKEAKLPDWISSYVASKGFKINTDASRMLAEYLGTDLGKVVNEMSKLAIILPAGASITPQVIEENIGISKDYNVWELQKALGQKDVLKANRIINYFEATRSRIRFKW